ncbi:hypothetical protein [Massilia sp. erpn]|uniref:hypothetical protein n=1 Tax=Massilia sp. erpn TaxID=2738142 RepID=UPI002103001D|nr:hypothetical protein [Massilia sp. erpn]UTY59483.1 hypothetical protein HPQ68_21285 [Massilia sp. erpn]
MLTAAKKRLKAHIVVKWLSLIAIEHNLDMTPTLAHNIVKTWLGRCAARPTIAAMFGLPGRTAASKSADRVQVIELAASYRDRVMADIDAIFVNSARAA